MRRLALAFSFVMMGLISLLPSSAYALWAEPSCDPSADPTTCNVSAPINVSSVSQTKAGALTITGALTANNGLTVNTANSTFNTRAVFNNAVDIGGASSAVNYTGSASNFTLTADSINDSEVSNTLTSSIFIGTGSTTNAVDLGTGELNTTGETWVNTTGDTMTGALVMSTSGLGTPAISITQPSTQVALLISGASGSPAISLNPTGGTGDGVNITMGNGTNGQALDIYSTGTAAGYAVSISSTSTATGAYPLNITASGATRSINVSNSVVGGYGIYAASTGATGIGVAGAGTTYGLAGTTTTGYGVYGRATNSGYAGYFDSSTTAGSGVYITLSSGATTSTSKALEVAGKNGYGGYFTANGSTSTALYVENTSSSYGTVKYGIQAVATTPSGIGIQATSLYGQAGKFIANSGGTAIEIDTDGGAADSLAIYTDGGTIDHPGQYLGGQFFPANSSSNDFYANATPEVVDTISFTAAPGSNAGGIAFDGSDIWVGGGAHPSVLGSVSVQRVSAYNGQETAYYDPSTVPAFGWSPGAIVYANDRMYVYPSSSANTEYIRMYSYSDSISSGTLSTGISVLSGTYDGEDIWLGTSNSVYKMVGRTTQTSVKTGTGSIEAIVYADDYIWALDEDNEVVYKINPSTNATSSTITVGNDPIAMVFDGQFLWVANSTDGALTRINVTDNTTASVSISGATSMDTMAFDGVHLWVTSNSSLYGYNVAQQTTDQTLTLSSSYNDALFDGTYLWLADASGSVAKVSVGRGQGHSMSAYPRGMIIFGNDELYHCLYFDSTGTLADSTSLGNCQ